MSGATLTIRDLYVYPVKSAAGIRLTEAPLGMFGIAGDRRWMFVDETYRFLTQRELPRLALVRPLAWEPDLVLSAPGLPDLVVPTPDTRESTVDVDVWGDHGAAHDAGHAAARWASICLGRPSRLVYAPDAFLRPVDPNFDSAAGTPHAARTGFSDGFPLLLIGQASLAALNGHLTARGEAPVGMDRFRPSLVVEGGDAHDEDTWPGLIVGDGGDAIRLDIVKPCARCAIVPVEQRTGVRGVEPLRTLASYRTRQGKVLFGQNVIHRTRGTLRVGDVVTPTRVRP